MHEPERNDPCPCGSGRKFKKCCEPLLAGAAMAETAEALMRSRYTAFATGDAEHLYRTAHPEHESVRGQDRERYLAETREYCRRVEFTGLTVHEATPEGPDGIARVRFTAAYQVGGRAYAFTERSEFARLDGRWVYLRGEAEEV